MGIKLHIHKTHRQFADGSEFVEVKGNTIGECLDHLIIKYPGMREALFDKKGKLRNVIEIYVNMKSAYPDELAKIVSDGDEVHIIYLLTGG